MMHAFLLVFMLCGPAAHEDAPLDTCEEGNVRAVSCAAAERWLRAGLRDGQTLHVRECGPRPSA